MRRTRLSRCGGKLREARLKPEGYIDSVTFTSPIVKERSISPYPEHLGTHKSTMTLREVEGRMFIEWEIPDIEEYVEIGIWTAGHKVTDYDGVFELPREAIMLLRKNGFDTKEVEP